MSTAVDLVNLRKRVADAVRLGVVEEADKDIYEATLIQILNESERQRIRCNNLVEEFKRKAAQSEAQANAYSQVSSIIYNVINGYVLLAEKSKREEEDQDKDRNEDVVNAQDGGVPPRAAASKQSANVSSQPKAEASEPEDQGADSKEGSEAETPKPVKKTRKRSTRAASRRKR